MNKSYEDVLINKIKIYFQKLTYFEKYNFDIIITLLSIFFVLLVVLYIYFLSRISLEKINWNKNKCNPFYMPFAKSINNGGDKFNEENLNNCLNNLTSNIAFDVLSPINAIINLFSTSLLFLTGIFSQFLGYIMQLFNLLLSLFRELMQRIERIIKENIAIFSVVNDFIASILGFITTIYNIIVLLVDSIKLIFPMLALSFLYAVVLPTLIALIISIVMLAIYFFIAWFFSPFLCMGCWAWPAVIIYKILVIFLTIFFILVLVLYTIFANMCNDILISLLEPVSRIDNDTMIQPAPVNNPQ